jgi:hypothetical protein
MGVAQYLGENVFARLWRWTKGQIVADVPDNIALCEFSCRKLQCSMGEWANCERRIRNAAGELTPLALPAPAPPAKTAP